MCVSNEVGEVCFQMRLEDRCVLKYVVRRG